ncbi:hypothetical protein HELRODRAFT_175035 [Helobdella robusta]|uniref:Uncharacterized protein n=1 Tax=Helobdella robusta TaxID=6412 RepID=T1F8R6_HELRO|nr:hypothetical protein HELRODRAFT_175035 [Helobdella robusta]ESO01011.1 hypothetical protein HELRODRAFT_175035 [Helobdella robusta]
MDHQICSKSERVQNMLVTQSNSVEIYFVRQNTPNLKFLVKYEALLNSTEQLNVIIQHPCFNTLFLKNITVLIIINYKQLTETIGCADLILPASSSFSILDRKGDGLSIACSFNKRQLISHLTCHDRRWIGELRNCSALHGGTASSGNNADSSRLISSNYFITPFYYVV